MKSRIAAWEGEFMAGKTDNKSEEQILIGGMLHRKD